MSTLPPIQRLVVEDFPDQKKWLGKLLQPLNQFMEAVYSGFNQNLTLEENMAAKVLSAEVDGTFPLKLAWSLKRRPIAVLVGDVQRTNGADVTLDSAVGVKWSFNQAGQLQIDAVKGLTTAAPSATVKYKLTLICFTG